MYKHTRRFASGIVRLLGIAGIAGIAGLLLSLRLASPRPALAESSSLCPGETGYFYTNDRNKRNPGAGGFVSDSANVGDNVFIAKTAAVCGSASILKFARIYGNALVTDEAEVGDEARVYGHAIVSGTALISGKAKVSDYARVAGDATVAGSAWIRGYKEISTGNYVKGIHKAEKPTWQFEKKSNAERNASLDEIVEQLRQGRDESNDLRPAGHGATRSTKNKIEIATGCKLHITTGHHYADTGATHDTHDTDWDLEIASYTPRTSDKKRDRNEFAQHDKHHCAYRESFCYASYDEYAKLDSLILSHKAKFCSAP